MPTLLTLAPSAFFAGFLMFLAPCTLPIVPGYLAFIANVPMTVASTKNTRRKIIINAIGFVVGFTTVFVLLGMFASALGYLLGPWRPLLGKAAGIAIIYFGLTLTGILKTSFLLQEKHIRTPSFLKLGHWQSSLFMGILFALGWSPCIGPILGSTLLLASISSTALQGAVLLSIFSLGLGIPFLIVAVFMEKISGYVVRFASLTGPLSILGGYLLIALGILMVLGNMGLLILWGNSLLSFIHYDRLLNYM